MLAVVLSLPGIHWGWVECWNYDQMGHLRLRKDYLPKHYLKPPFLTYLNEFLVIVPGRFVMGNVFSLKQEVQRPVLLILSRLLTVGMFAGSVLLVYGALKRSGVGEGVATWAAMLMGTSSGMLVFNRFLTADSPLIFWMILSFYFALKAAEERSERWAVVSGLMVGLSAAMKYNGLLVAVALPAAVVAAMGWKGLLWRGLWLGGLVAPVGFAIGNPGVIFDFGRFYQDFMYNLRVTPVYEGQSGGHGYGIFWTFLPEIVGWGGVVLVGIGVVLLVWGFCVGWGLPAKGCVVAAAAVFFFYYWKMGEYPRVTRRFVLPAVPFLLVVAAVGWSGLRGGWARVGAGLAGLVLVYNVAASVESGLRFVADPRMAALGWMREHVQEGEVVENSYAPDWRKLRGFRGQVRVMPAVTGRAELFAHMFAGDSAVGRGVVEHETPVGVEELFTEEALRQRAPEWVAFSSHVFDWTGVESVQRFYGRLDAEGWGYQKVFERRGREVAWWSYPQGIDFLARRMVVLRRMEEGGEKKR